MSKESNTSTISMPKNYKLFISVMVFFSLISFVLGYSLQLIKSGGAVAEKPYYRAENAISTSCETRAALKPLSTEPLSTKKVENGVNSAKTSFSEKKTQDLIALQKKLLEGDITLSKTDFFEIQNELVARLNSSEDERHKFRESFIENASSPSADIYLAVMQQMEGSRAELTKAADTLATSAAPEFYDHIINAVSYGGMPTENIMRVFEEIMKGGGSEKQSLNILASINPYEASDNLIRHAKERTNHIFNNSTNAGSRAQALDRMLSLTPYVGREAVTLKGLQDSNIKVNYSAISSIASGSAPYNQSIKEKLLTLAAQPEHPLSALAKQVIFSRDNLTKEELAKIN